MVEPKLQPIEELFERHQDELLDLLSKRVGRADAQIILAQADNGVRNDGGAEALPPTDVGAERARPSNGKPGAAD